MPRNKGNKYWFETKVGIGWNKGTTIDYAKEYGKHIFGHNKCLLHYVHSKTFIMLTILKKCPTCPVPAPFC